VGNNQRVEFHRWKETKPDWREKRTTPEKTMGIVQRGKCVGEGGVTIDFYAAMTKDSDGGGTTKGERASGGTMANFDRPG